MCGYGILKCYHLLMYYTTMLIVYDYMLIKCTCMGDMPTYSFLWIMLAMGFGYM